MRKVVSMMFMTLDGFAEFPDYGDDPIAKNPNEGPPMWESAPDSIDTLLLGRKTYQLWADFWPRRKDDPEATKFEKEFSRFADRAEKVVFSNTLQSADWPTSRIVRGDLSQEIARLKSGPGKNMVVAGPRLLQAFLERELVDDLYITMLPSIIGSGKLLFRVASDPDHAADVVPLGAPGRHDFTLIEARPLKDKTLLLHYAPAGSAKSH
jgi:dihydrofolate reductase